MQKKRCEFNVTTATFSIKKQSFFEDCFSQKNDQLYQVCIKSKTDLCVLFYKVFILVFVKICQVFFCSS